MMWGNKSIFTVKLFCCVHFMNIFLITFCVFMDICNFMYAFSLSSFHTRHIHFLIILQSIYYSCVCMDFFCLWLNKSMHISLHIYISPIPLSVYSLGSLHKASSVWTPGSCPSAGTVEDIPLDIRGLSGCPLAFPFLITIYSRYLVTRD